VGDRASDVAAGDAAGCQTVFIDRGYSEPKPKNAMFTALSTKEAADLILAHSSVGA
jgi:phosphoglycolate phosphatase-like HAD superfamily hydrolase